MRHFKLKDYLISVMIITVTLLYFFIIPLVSKDVKTIYIFGLEIGSFGFVNIYDLVYFTKMKMLILFFSITWYLTCRHWWKPVILIVIIMELFKLASIFNSNFTQIDEIEFMTSMPITIPIIVLLILFSIKIKRFKFSKEVRNELDKEIDGVFFELNIDKLNRLDELKNRIKIVRKKYYHKDRKKYIKELTIIRNDFYKM